MSKGDQKPQQMDMKLATVIEIKAAIAKIQEENNQLGTQVTRQRKTFTINSQKLQQIKDIDEKAQLNSTRGSISSSTASSTKPPPIQNSNFHEVLDKKKALLKSICQCGAPNPKFRDVSGFCGDCVRKMKDDYQAAYNEYMPIANEYEMIFTKNTSVNLKYTLVVQERMIQMSSKIQNMMKKLEGAGSFELDPEEKMVKEEMNYLKTQTSLLRTEREIRNSDFQRMLDDNSNLKATIQTKIIRKTQKIKILSEEIEEYEKKIADITESLKSKQLKLQNAL